MISRRWIQDIGEALEVASDAVREARSNLAGVREARDTEKALEIAHDRFPLSVSAVSFSGFSDAEQRRIVDAVKDGIEWGRGNR